MDDMQDDAGRRAYLRRDRRQSIQTVGVVAALILFICVVFGGLFGAAQFLG
ncbi:hypothetical protein [Methylobacterium symbioticum]|nr:hypothetical protein [Methylobacterium symbioticum]